MMLLLKRLLSRDRKRPRRQLKPNATRCGAGQSEHLRQNSFKPLSVVPGGATRTPFRSVGLKVFRALSEPPGLSCSHGTYDEGRTYLFGDCNDSRIFGALSRC